MASLMMALRLWLIVGAIVDIVRYCVDVGYGDVNVDSDGAGVVIVCVIICVDDGAGGVADNGVYGVECDVCAYGRRCV